MNEETILAIRKAVISLCERIEETTANAWPSDKEVASLPEVVKATAELAGVLVSYDIDRLMRKTSHHSAS